MVIDLSHIHPIQSNVHFFSFIAFALSKRVSLVIVNIAIARDCNITLKVIISAT